jgi:hypothetical protein
MHSEPLEQLAPSGFLPTLQVLLAGSQLSPAAVLHCASLTQATQLPAPSHTLPPLSEHAVPAASGGWLGFMPSQASPVHALPSSGGTSVVSASDVVPPLPSQTTSLQSPLVCSLVGVPLATFVKPHMLPSQVGLLHSVPPPHWSFPLHSTQLPLPSQTLPPPSVQAVLKGSFGWSGTPFSHVSAVHSLPSSGGTSSSSATTSPCTCRPCTRELRRARISSRPARSTRPGCPGRRSSAWCIRSRRRGRRSDRRPSRSRPTRRTRRCGSRPVAGSLRPFPAARSSSRTCRPCRSAGGIRCPA